MKAFFPLYMIFALTISATKAWWNAGETTLSVVSAFVGIVLAITTVLDYSEDK